LSQLVGPTRNQISTFIFHSITYHSFMFNYCYKQNDYLFILGAVVIVMVW